MKAVDPATAYADRFYGRKSQSSGVNLMSEGFNAASEDATVFAYIEADGEDLKTPCFTFEAADITAQQAMRLLGFWQQIIREK